jgi:cysteinyl-tRNA synthetase
MSALADDLNTVAAVQALHALAQEANADKTLLPMFAASAALLGVVPARVEVDEALASAVDALVAMRLEMLKAKDFAEADKIRNELADKGIQLKDGKDPATGERVTTWEVKR